MSRRSPMFRLVCCLLGIGFGTGCDGRAAGLSDGAVSPPPSPSPLVAEDLVLCFPWTVPGRDGSWAELESQLDLSNLDAPKLLSFALDEALPPGLRLELELVEPGGHTVRRQLDHRHASLLIAIKPDGGRVRLRYRLRQETTAEPGTYARVISFTLLAP